MFVKNAGIHHYTALFQLCTKAKPFSLALKKYNRFE